MRAPEERGRVEQIANSNVGQIRYAGTYENIKARAMWLLRSSCQKIECKIGCMVRKAVNLGYRCGELDSLIGFKSDSLAEGNGEAVVVLQVVPALKGTVYSPAK